MKTWMQIKCSKKESHLKNARYATNGRSVKGNIVFNLSGMSKFSLTKRILT